MKHCLGPLIKRSSNILILGSFPGPLSLKKQEYYAYPQNQFWRFLANIFNHGRGLDSYKEKIELLSRSGIGLWDMVASCKRRGACDGNIKNMALNDISGLLGRYPNIEAVFFNGRKAEALFKKHCKASIRTQYLPSTSGTYAGISRDRKLKAWKRCFLKKSGEKEYGKDTDN